MMQKRSYNEKSHWEFLAVMSSSRSDFVTLLVRSFVRSLFTLFMELWILLPTEHTFQGSCIPLCGFFFLYIWILNDEKRCYYKKSSQLKKNYLAEHPGMVTLFEILFCYIQYIYILKKAFIFIIFIKEFISIITAVLIVILHKFTDQFL
jgi:hypothetical protein